MRGRDISHTLQQGNRKDPKFSLNVRRLIADGQLTLNQICMISGVAKSVAHGWVNGVTPRDLSAVAKLSDALNLQFRELLLGEKEPTQTQRDQKRSVVSEKELFENFCQIIIQKIEKRN